MPFLIDALSTKSLSEITQSPFLALFDFKASNLSSEFSDRRSGIVFNQRDESGRERVVGYPSKDNVGTILPTKKKYGKRAVLNAIDNSFTHNPGKKIGREDALSRLFQA